MARVEAAALSHLDPEIIKEAERISATMRISPPGSLGLPELLEDRRLKYDIPDGAFCADAVFDRVLVYQIDRVAGDTFENSVLHRPDISRAKQREECPVGIIVGAGLSALDSLRSHGIDLGHMVIFVHLAPFRFQCDTVDGKAVWVLLLRAGDIIASMDLREKTKGGEWSVKTTKDENGVSRHYLDKGTGAVVEGLYKMESDPVPGDGFSAMEAIFIADALTEQTSMPVDADIYEE